MRLTPRNFTNITTGNNSNIMLTRIADDCQRMVKCKLQKGYIVLLLAGVWVVYNFILVKTNTGKNIFTGLAVVYKGGQKK